MTIYKSRAYRKHHKQISDTDFWVCVTGLAILVVGSLYVIYRHFIG